MEVVALCNTPMVQVLFLLCVLDQKVDSVFLHVDPNRLQFFEYETLALHCASSFSSPAGVKIVHEFNGELLSCETPGKETSTWRSCTVRTAYADDTGLFWCESGQNRSNLIHITVTNGSVILVSPVLPVMGEVVTLRCRTKTSSNLSADFYKDGRLISSSPTAEVTISRFSNTDEGLYKCRVSGAGESPASLLAATDHKVAFPTPSSCIPWIFISVFIIALLLLVGFLHFGKVFLTKSGSGEDQTASVGNSAANADKAMYACGTRNRQRKDEDKFSSKCIYYKVGEGVTQQPEPEQGLYSSVVFPPSTSPPLIQEAVYSEI